MQHHGAFRLMALICFLSISLLMSSCSKKDAPKETGYFSPGKVSVLTPVWSGNETVGGDPLLLDISNINQGYFMGILNKANTTVHIQIIGPDTITYKYFVSIPDTPTVFPLTAGDGTYTILAFESIDETQYVSLFSQMIQVKLENQFLPFLYPNQFVNFSQDSDAVKLTETLTQDMTSDVDALSAIYGYVTGHITYDNEKAASVPTRYLPDIDQTLQEGTGICFDYASLTAAMLRSVGIPSKLSIGYSSSVKHAWIDVYIQSMGWVEHAVEFNGDEWKLMDPTFSAADDDSIQEYIGDQSNYITEYVR